MKKVPIFPHIFWGVYIYIYIFSIYWCCYFFLYLKKKCPSNQKRINTKNNKKHTTIHFFKLHFFILPTFIYTQRDRDRERDKKLRNYKVMQSVIASLSSSSSKVKSFIRQVRSCNTAAEERALIARECASIRSEMSELSNSTRQVNISKLLVINSTFFTIFNDF